MSWRDYSLCHACNDRMVGCLAANQTKEKEGRPLSNTCRDVPRHRLVPNQRRNQGTASGFRKTPEQRETIKGFRVLPESVQRAKLQGSADLNASGEGTRGSR
jgi:hypothetical protein